MPRKRSYKAELLRDLQDPIEAQGYLNAALEEDDHELFLLALRHVVEARLGITELAEQAELSRTALYRTLSEAGNPELTGLNKILRALGYRLAIQQKDPENQAAA